MRDRSDAYVLSDEVYKDLLYTGSHVSIAAMPGMQDRTIIPRRAVEELRHDGAGASATAFSRSRSSMG